MPSFYSSRPLVAGAAVAMLRAGAASVAVGEGLGHRRDIEYLLISSGLYDQLKELRIPFVDLNATVRPGPTIVDAVVAMEGDGPIMGSPRPVGFIAMGTDVVAVDATCARVIGLEPRRLSYLESASAFLGNLDDARIDQRGEAPARYRTRFAVVESLRQLRDKP